MRCGLPFARVPLVRKQACPLKFGPPRVSPNPHRRRHDPLTRRDSPGSLSITSEDLAKLGVDAQLIPSIISMMSQGEQSPNGSTPLSQTDAENLIENLDKVYPIV